MSFPSFYDPAHLTPDYRVNYEEAFAQGQTNFKSAATNDARRVLLWLIDVQDDFVFPTGRLAVPNAVDDTCRTVEFIYNNVHAITQIAASLDTHTPYQIFYPSWWANQKGEHPAPFTVITSADVDSGKWFPVVQGKWSRNYLKELEKSAKKSLMIWPFHCMEGSTGRALVPQLHEAIVYHSGARASQPDYISKGTIPQTEYYSMVEPEVKVPNHPEGNINASFLDMVESFDVVYIAGQARSHCVLETLNSVRHYFKADVFAKLRFLDDCTSSITGFEKATELAIADHVQAGMQLVHSTDRI